MLCVLRTDDWGIETVRVSESELCVCVCLSLSVAWTYRIVRQERVAVIAIIPVDVCVCE